MTKPPFMALLGIAVVAGCTSEGLGSGQTSCAYRGKSYQPGASIPADDGCTTCSCESKGEISCTTRYCQPDAAPPPANGDAAASDLGRGPDLVPGPDAGGSAGDTRLGFGDVASDTGGDAVLACFFGTMSIPAGQSIFDGCNTCMCGVSGQLMCTNMYCPPPVLRRPLSAPGCPASDRPRYASAAGSLLPGFVASSHR
jgi:hypothetical protein